MRFDRARGLWTALGDATEVRRTDERKAILDGKLLEKMVKAGEIFQSWPRQSRSSTCG
jgi:hypothetical protein